MATVAVLAAGVAGAVGLLADPGARPRPVASGVEVALSHTRHAIESMFQDDRALIYSPRAKVVRTLDALRALGVDRLRVTMLWSAIAPAPLAPTAPAGFAPTDPGAYPAGAWAPYDRLLALARARGLAVDLDLTAPGPLWAMRSGAPLPREADHFAPLATSFEHFVIAVGRRYSGRYVPARARAALPRVDYWSVWNEPNQPGWLAPQSAGSGPATVLEAARLYRGYVDAAFAGLDLTGHRRDTILIGELAPEGDELRGPSRPVPPLPFLRALYCVGADARPLTGPAALALACPATTARRVFVSAHPGLFAATGFAHHPYSFFLAPGASMSDPNFVPLADLGRLEHDLDRIFAAYAVPHRLPLYLTEYGYETDPPNPFRGVSVARQAAYLDEAEYLAWRDPRVRTLSQFLFYDSPPDRAYPRGSVGYWSTFQTGLAFLDGRAKPAFYSYRLPIYLPETTFVPGARVTVWGLLRSAPNRGDQRATLQWRPSGGAWRAVDRISTAQPTGVLQVRVTLPGTGGVRLAWTESRGSGGVVYSRSVAVRQHS
ncbi:MAG: hypothetical protein ACRDNK_05350 [Solirubrobacteraceae bacterium]